MLNIYQMIVYLSEGYAGVGLCHLFQLIDLEFLT